MDEKLMKQALGTISKAYEEEVKRFNEANRQKAQAAHDAAMARWNAERKARNDDTGTQRRRDREQGFRSAGDKPPPAPKFPDYETWGEKMNAERKAELHRDPGAGKKDRILISDEHPLNCAPVKGFIKKYRGTLSDERIKSLLRQAFAEYERAWKVRAGLIQEEMISP